ncbi:NAD(P)-dependent oxidoreductase [Hansschlegelia quercus]|uniref:NAD(P)-dependent oxidoreductase n=1 Tax=Hansschlegelia quercus TaxID=2528245 RepID=A0A4V2JE22_9HYPH|nr:NAD(P)-dependent oxidoreductase [Hansschlegelia quercus]TBN53546.1 NAD(P)-dependent oxidoreductase [Hansschlegelia quercus]
MAKVAFLGLGVMGFPMAGYLASRGGHDVVVYNRTPAKAEAWAKQFRGAVARTPQEAAEGRDFVMACVGDDDDVRSVSIGVDGAFQSMPANSVFVDHTTASAEVARQLAVAARERGFHVMDAPVSGGRRGAENGSLTIMCGGDDHVYERVALIVASYAAATTHIGPVGSGQLTKMVNQICLVGLIEGLAEGIHFAKRAGLDLEKVIGAISQGSARSWQMENHWESMNEGRFDFGFAVELMRKDLSICNAEARRNGASLPMAALVDTFFAEVERMGGNRWDTSSLLSRLERN